MTDNQTDLKPCPFCGGEAVKDHIQTSFFVKCSSCKITTSSMCAIDSCIEAWNVRTTPTDTKGAVEEIAKIIYKAMEWACANNTGDLAPKWVKNGNSHAQREARSKANALIFQGYMRDWQPIETAPQGAFVGYWPYWTKETIRCCRFEDNFYSDEGFVCSDGLLDSENCPTHWMPLPPSPDMEGKG